MIITLRGFGGKSPRIDAQQLPDSGAQTATNTKMWGGVLSSFRDTSTVTAMAGTIKSIYRFGGGANEAQYWFGFANDVDVVRGPVAGDTSQRTYYTGDGVPKVTDAFMATTGAPYPTAYYQLGVPKPSSACSATVSGSGTGNAETRIYVYTYVSAWGEEGQPSDVSSFVEVLSGQTVTVSAMSGNPGGQRNLNRKRLYRSVLGASGTTGFLLCQVRLSNNAVTYDIPIGETSVVDVSTSSTIGEALSTIDYSEPPTDLFGLVALPGGVLAGLSKNDVCFSEPFNCYAWPLKYQLTLDYDAVGLGAFGTTVVALTNGHPYLITGSTPDSMSMQKMELRQACVSKRSIVSSGDMVLYASPDGLVSVGAGGVRIISESVMSRDDWQALKPESIVGFVHEQRYIGFYDTGTVQAGFVFDLANRQYYDITTFATAGYSDLIKDALFLRVGTNIVKWEGGSGALSYTWKSKKFTLAKPASLSAAIVQSATYPVTAKFYADGVLKLTKTVSDAKAFRLPSGFLAKQWEFELSGTASVLEMQVATSVEELRSN